MILSLNRGRRINFLVKLFFKLFSFLDNLKNGFLTFLIAAFDQKLQLQTYTRFSDFHDFHSKILGGFVHRVGRRLLGFSSGNREILAN